MQCMRVLELCFGMRLSLNCGSLGSRISELLASAVLRGGRAGEGGSWHLKGMGSSQA